MISKNRAELKTFLDQEFDHFNTEAFIALDPISIPHQFTKKQDIEIAAFLTATIAWGQRLTLVRNANQLMQWMDYQPHQFIVHHSPNDLKPFEKFVHRTFNGENCRFFIQRLNWIYKQHESLELAFKPELSSVKDSIIHFRQEFLGQELNGKHTRHISNPADNSAAKRINMFLRWMVRSDERKIDFGIWKQFNPSQLFIPLDVHSGSVARELGILQRKQDDWKAVEELTEVLRSFDLSDPVKYDYALFGLGVSGKWKSMK